MSNKKVTVIIAAHKKYRMPEDAMYLPLHVGAEGKEPIGFQTDNTGDNISSLNPFFCELTGMYWAWKNLDSDYIGLAHYRRHFSFHPHKKDVWDNVLTYDELAKYLDHIRVFTPQKRRYYIETLYSHYDHTHYINQLDETRKILSEKYPDYTDSFDKVVKQRWGYMFNMMIMEKSLFDDYCTWLFSLLFELRERLGEEGLTPFHQRYYGRVSEIAFNVWLKKQIADGRIKKSQTKEIPLIHMEPINWRKKGMAFLKAKFLKKKYEGSF